MGKGSAPSAPAMSAEEKALLQKQSDLLTQLGQIYGSSIASSNEQQDLFKRVSGLYKTQDDGKLVLDQDAVTKQTDLAKIQLDRYEKALRGELPVSEGTLQRKSKEFGLLKENAARRGIVIEGDSIDNATSNSTSGSDLLGQFKRSYGLLEDSERRGELAGAVNPSFSMLGASNAAGPSSFLGAGGGLLNAYQSASHPYANQRNLEYQSALANYGYGQQRRGGILGGALSGAATGAALGLPAGGIGAGPAAMIGGGLGLLGGIGL